MVLVLQRCLRIPSVMIALYLILLRLWLVLTHVELRNYCPVGPTRQKNVWSSTRHPDVCGCKISQKVEGHDRLRLQQTRQLMTRLTDDDDDDDDNSPEHKGERWPSGLGRRPATGRSMVRVPLR